ncbi:MAG TPA: DUF2127 domain-containing protein [Acidobacteriaceae bacterium]|nr:DUF2127 domain-containing protein [Acidobacteriaceae bacterium]
MAAADQPRPAQELARGQAGSPDDPCSSAERRGLFLVGVFKLSKAVFFTSVGAGALHLVHRNLGDLVMRLIDSLPIDPEGRVVGMIMDKTDLIDAHDLRRIGAGAFIYALLCLVEGTGLLMRKTWAEYFTVVLTALGLPVESFEILHRFNWYKVGALAINLVILLYLLWVLKKRGKNIYPQSV